jgi:hypothetical protein
MSESHSHEHPGAASPSVFSVTQWEMFRADDRKAAANIVCLMTGIFVCGLIGYLCIAYIVGS